MRGAIVIALLFGALAITGCSSIESASGSGAGCSPNYEGACLKQDAGDYDCEGGEGDGPNYVGSVKVVGSDEFDLDRDGDGQACDDSGWNDDGGGWDESADDGGYWGE